MKTLVILIIVLGTIGYFIYAFFKPSGDTVTSVGSTNDMETNIDRMMKSTKKDAFLIAKVQGTNDFIQFSGDAKGVQLDFPLVTDRQISMEAAFKIAARELNLHVSENKGSSGHRFLDIDLSGGSTEIALVATSLMKKLFGVTEHTKIKYEINT